MTFLELAKQRYSVRSYKSAPVEDDKLKQVLEAGGCTFCGKFSAVALYCFS